MGTDCALLSGQTIGDSNFGTAHNTLGSPERRLILGEGGEAISTAIVSYESRGVPIVELNSRRVIDFHITAIPMNL
jgi:hypothetical protein